MMFLKTIFHTLFGFISNAETMRIHDRMHARQFQQKDRFKPLFYVSIFGFIICVFVLCFCPLTKQTRLLIAHLAGIFMHAIREIYRFEFGGG